MQNKVINNNKHLKHRENIKIQKQLINLENVPKLAFPQKLNNIK